MPDYQVLKTEISLPAYTGLSDQAVADKLNAKTVDLLVPISRTKLATWIGANYSLYTAIKAAESNTLNSNALRGAAWAALRAIDTPEVSSLDLADPNVMALLDGLVSGGVMNSAQKSSLLAEGTIKISRAVQLGLGIVTQYDVKKARGGVD